MTQSGESFCNFDGGHIGNCEDCSEFYSEDDCFNTGLPDKGAKDCSQRCFNILNSNFSS